MDPTDRLAQRRFDMVNTQLAARGVRSERVLNALRSVPRELFLPPELEPEAYDDRALGIGQGQTISQPYIVGLMSELLAIETDDRILEIGTGTGYQTAILSRLAGHVYSIERLGELSALAKARLAEMGVRNATLRIGDGSRGWPEAGPFDGIIVTAAAPTIPKELVEQLVEGGRLVIPVGGEDHQCLTVVRREGGKIVESPGIGVRFVKLIGQSGFAP